MDFQEVGCGVWIGLAQDNNNNNNNNNLGTGKDKISTTKINFLGQTVRNFITVLGKHTPM
jgi:hypothetical protein